MLLLLCGVLLFCPRVVALMSGCFVVVVSCCCVVVVLLLLSCCCVVVYGFVGDVLFR